MRREKGITLIALIITIIVLLILAGITINLTLGESGIIKRAQEAGIENEKEQLKEELELAILDIQANKLSQEKKMTREDLSELENIGAIIESTAIPAQGEYKNYYFEIDEDYKVTVTEKIEGEKPKITVELITTDPVAEGKTVEIKVTASISEGNIVSIEATNGAVLKTDTSSTEKIFEVSANGTYYFKATADNGLSRTASIIIDSMLGWKDVLSKANIDCSVYNNFSSAMTDENIQKLVQSTEAMDTIGIIFSNAENFSIIANNSVLMSAICENSNARLALYDNYEVTESIIANSTVALESMKSSSRYEVINKSISKYAGRIEFTTMYNGKAFVLGMSQNRNTDGGFKTESGEYLSVRGGIVKTTCNYTCGTTGLIYAINKFASTVKMDPYGRDPAQSSIDITINGYMAIFKI